MEWPRLGPQDDIDASESLLSLVWPALDDFHVELDASNIVADCRVVDPEVLILLHDKIVNRFAGSGGLDAHQGLGYVFAFPAEFGHALLDILLGYAQLFRNRFFPRHAMGWFGDGPKRQLRIQQVLIWEGILATGSLVVGLLSGGLGGVGSTPRD